MKPSQAVDALAALAHEHRLALFRLLVQRGPEGLAAGVIAVRLGVAPSSLTFHLQALHRAGLLAQRREGRQLIYSTDFTTMNSLLAYLTENCCESGKACAPACAPPARTARRARRVA